LNKAELINGIAERRWNMIAKENNRTNGDSEFHIIEWHLLTEKDREWKRRHIEEILISACFFELFLFAEECVDKWRSDSPGNNFWFHKGLDVTLDMLRGKLDNDEER